LAAKRRVCATILPSTLRTAGNQLISISEIDPDLPVIIAGPTASGKSALAMEIARGQGRTIVNADALQVWSCWQVLSARPDAADEASVPHRLYGHVMPGAAYSVGHWLREVAEILAGDPRPVIVGGTGLYVSALTEGLAEIPATPAAVRRAADARIAAGDATGLLAELDPETAARIDRQNPARIQRAWEVLQATGRGLAAWQAETGTPVLAPGMATLLLLNADRDWLADRIDRRFDMMLAAGALDEARSVLPRWNPAAPWAKAIGAPELIAHLRGQMTLEAAATAAKAASRQYAKRQRTWFRKRMSGWRAAPTPQCVGQRSPNMGG
jgi:tRNA dimethylallyltransferase